MKALYITSKPAYPRVDGGCVASANFLDNLLKVVSQVKYLTIATNKHPFELNRFPNQLIDAVSPQAILIETAVRPREAIKYLFNNKSYNIDRFYDETMTTMITTTLENNSYD
ncbi:MAG: hypothetical protein HRT57_01085, partial [Crocinitomicaceae bacterium]|nr:hypothetical protein [Crocinitomicaceae bacterium]